MSSDTARNQPKQTDDTAVLLTAVVAQPMGKEPSNTMSPLRRFVLALAVLVGFAGASITAFPVQGELQVMMKGCRMQQHIDQLKDHYILCGCRAIGREIVQEFHAENVPYVVADSSIERAEIPRDFDVTVVEGDATNDEVHYRLA